MLVSFALVPPSALSRTLAAVRAEHDPEHAAKTIPHLTHQATVRDLTTLAQGLTPTLAREALQTLDILLPISFTASALVMGVRAEHGVWHRPHTLAFSA